MVQRGAKSTVEAETGDQRISILLRNRIVPYACRSPLQKKPPQAPHLQADSLLRIGNFSNGMDIKVRIFAHRADESSRLRPQ